MWWHLYKWNEKNKLNWEWAHQIWLTLTLQMAAISLTKKNTTETFSQFSDFVVGTIENSVLLILNIKWQVEAQFLNACLANFQNLYNHRQILWALNKIQWNHLRWFCVFSMQNDRYNKIGRSEKRASYVHRKRCRKLWSNHCLCLRPVKS